MELKYSMPTRVLMGAGIVAASAAELAAFGAKALIVTGSHSAKASGALVDVVAALDGNGQAHALFDRVKSNPTVDAVYAGAKVAREFGADFVIAIGGGSPMDAAKAIALLARQDIPRDRLFAGQYGVDALPMVHVPTTAGTGSEVTQYAILTNDVAETKTSIATPALFPKLALLDAKYLASLPRATAVNTAIDALSHAVEGMLSVRASPVSDALASESIRLISACFRDLAEDTLDDTARERLLVASTLAGMVIANTGTTVVHAMGYSLTYFRDVDHGRANGLLLCEYLKFAQRQNGELVRRILAPTGIGTVAALKSVLDGLLGKRETLTVEEIDRFSAKAAASKNLANCAVVPDLAAIREMYLAAFDAGASHGKSLPWHASGIPYVALSDYLSPAHFRTITAKVRGIPGGVTEIPVTLELTPAFAAKLKFPVPWDGKVYGFVHDNARLAAVFTGAMAKDYAARRIYLNDWGAEFMLTFESGDRSGEVSYFVTPSEVRDLLDNCFYLLDV